MKNLLFLLALMFAFATTSHAQCAAPVLSPVGVSGETWNVDVSIPYSNAMFELCWSHNGVTMKQEGSNGLPKQLGFTGTATAGVWYYGAQVGDSVWVNEYCIIEPFYMGPYFVDLYNSVKADRSNWVKSNVVRIAAMPGVPATGSKKNTRK